MLESKVIRINADVIEKLNQFIENDEKISKFLSKHLPNNEEYNYIIKEINQDDINKWLNYALTYAIASQDKMLKLI